MSNNETKDIQKQLLKLLKLFDDLCEKNNIKYTLHGGTLLGAIREKGFIPWDDDIDVGIMRSDFEKLRELMRTKLTPELYYYNYGQAHKIFFKEEGKPFVWLDLFIYDYISEKRAVQKLKFFLLSFMRVVCKNEDMLKITKKRGKYTGFKFLLICAISGIGKVIPIDKKTLVYEHIMKAFSGKGTLIHRSNDQYIGMVIVLPTNVMENYIKIPFEDSLLMVSEKYHEILVGAYGDDYMIPQRFDGDVESHRELARFSERELSSSNK